ncbi:MAG: PilT/PilU family type 4a pilus ATPase [Myxococcales bacterium]|nr:PilT/PilU family type 4a pilus ATPase [Myxococcales bacterium]MCB9644437.1 PilT/PilU family type 4a pilus ATPase [Myxococcales bacterium]
MAIFTGKKNIVQQIQSNAWQSPQEKQQILLKLRESGPRSAEVVPLLLHRDSDVRRFSAEIFLARPDIGGAKALLDSLENAPPQARSFGGQLLSKMPAEMVQRVLDGLLKDRNASKQRMGWEIAVALTGRLGAIYLERAVLEGPTALRPIALQKLLQERQPRQVQQLLVELANDKDTRIATVALEALSHVQSGSPKIMEIMLSCLAGQDAARRQLASQYLQQNAQSDPAGMRKRMYDLLNQGEDASRRQALEIILRTGDTREILTELLLYLQELAGWLRDRILDMLRGFGEEILRAAVALLQHPQEEVRTAALILAENFQDPRILGPICNLLNDEDWWLRVNACDTLGRLKDERAVPYLVQALQDEEARWAAIDSLAQIGSQNALKPLAQLLRDKRQEVRLEVISAFDRFTHPSLLPLLRSVRERDPSVEVRTRATEVSRNMAGRLKVEEDEDIQTQTEQTFDKPIDQLLSKIRDRGASDLHITVEEPPFSRYRGELSRLEDEDEFTAETTEETLMSILDERQKKIFQEVGEIDFCYSIPEVGRYRANAFVQRRGVCMTFRTIPNIPPTFEDLRIPAHITELLDYHQGIIVVSGPSSSGKSTTLAAIINLINESKPTHVITLEDPIEFVHPPKIALVNQREVGKHTESFARALRGALREDPDVIMVGEMRDPETIRMSLEAAETGHLVIATLHTTNAIQTVDRIIGAFPPSEQGQIRMSLSESLKYVMCQSLLPRKDGNGRVAVFEILKNTLNVSNLIREDKTYQLPSMMQIGRNAGMQTVDQALMALVQGDLISAEDAWLRAEKSETFEPMCSPQFLREKSLTEG